MSNHDCVPTAVSHCVSPQKKAIHIFLSQREAATASCKIRPADVDPFAARPGGKLVDGKPDAIPRRRADGVGGHSSKHSEKTLRGKMFAAGDVIDCWIVPRYNYLP
ncbi:MAG: hypothetical protein LBJ46_09565 [Planctomycetota bacterium]|jgi:hypothetical protein|nr:hypothetical protein [Planctomycetota bacterium]